MKQVRLMLADDHALFGEGLAGIITAQPDMKVVEKYRQGPVVTIR